MRVRLEIREFPQRGSELTRDSQWIHRKMILGNRDLVRSSCTFCTKRSCHMTPVSTNWSVELWQSKTLINAKG